MKALVIADRNPQINIVETVKNEQIDIIITLGDLERSDILQLAEIADIPKIGVYGNHDSGNYMEELGIRNMHRKIMDIKGVRFGGLEGCVRYKENPDAIMYTQDEAHQLLAGFPSVDVFIAHCPPRGVNDEEEIAHQGFDALRDYVLATTPKLLLHGHTYPTKETMDHSLGDTQIVYVHRYKIVELPEQAPATPYYQQLFSLYDFADRSYEYIIQHPNMDELERTRIIELLLAIERFFDNPGRGLISNDARTISDELARSALHEAHQRIDALRSHLDELGAHYTDAR